MTISRGKESPATLETLRDEARFEKSIPAATLPGHLLVCHTLMMDCHCFCVLLYVCLGHGWALTRVVLDIICRGKESPATLETLRDEARFEKSIPAATLPGHLLVCHTLMMDCHCF